MAATHASALNTLRGMQELQQRISIAHRTYHDF